MGMRPPNRKLLPGRRLISPTMRLIRAVATALPEPHATGVLRALLGFIVATFQEAEGLGRPYEAYVRGRGATLPAVLVCLSALAMRVCVLCLGVLCVRARIVFLCLSVSLCLCRCVSLCVCSSCACVLCV